MARVKRPCHTPSTTTPTEGRPAQSKTAEGRAVVGCQATVPRGTPTLGGHLYTPQWNTPTESCPCTINGLGGACSSEGDHHHAYTLGACSRHPQSRPPKDASAQSKTGAGCSRLPTVPRGMPTFATTVDTPQWNTPTKLGPAGGTLPKLRPWKVRLKYLEYLQ